MQRLERLKKDEKYNPSKPRRVVIKIGTSVLLDDRKRISIQMIDSIGEQIKAIQRKGVKPVIVTSGAIACGMEILNLKKKPKEIEKRQALASIGQVLLMKMYLDVFEKKDIKIGQILLTHEDIASKNRCLNLMNTLNALINMDIVPVINENDALSFKEIKFGDNDNLSALIAQISNADLLLLLSDVEGLYEKDPKRYPDARIIKLVERIDKDIEKTAGGTRSEKSIGGMVSKLEAAKKAGYYGIPTRIVKGDIKDIIPRVITGEEIGTLFLPRGKIARNKWWTAFAYKIKGYIDIDEGATQAIIDRGKSLLPSGIIGTVGEFSRGDCVELKGIKGRVIARGITNYSSSDINKIKGIKSVDIEKKLGYKYTDEIIHRDNMVIL
ncbi:MAG TPA: glutamate 5-kinase [Syntrophorhabdaceae bacterium]|nr:glutamate 5-kinase [Syntrophorhabdaceae bacterium]HOL05758.1 glutamate 5-kinase [Syntrophorhabdaceae bacterium]HON85577.1 glutamate 5-kinase [Syntrophorhabdaceae bacterium]HPP42174.1 glutamate 5-kinase [Syntrophorhabdaceae bacterium]